MFTDMRDIEILMVEDDPADAELVREAFKRFDVAPRLDVIDDGQKALDRLRDAKRVEPDLILLDLNLPKLDGRQVLRAIKADRRLRKIPTVVLTTSSADADVLQAYSDGANCFLTKPLGLDEFFHMTKALERFWLQEARLPTRPTASRRPT